MDAPRVTEGVRSTWTPCVRRGSAVHTDAPCVTEEVRSTRMPRVRRRNVVPSDVPREERAPPVAPCGPSRKEPAAPR